MKGSYEAVLSSILTAVFGKRSLHRLLLLLLCGNLRLLEDELRFEICQLGRCLLHVSEDLLDRGVCGVVAITDFSKYAYVSGYCLKNLSIVVKLASFTGNGEDEEDRAKKITLLLSQGL